MSSPLGQPVRRREDAALLTGRAMTGKELAYFAKVTARRRAAISPACSPATCW